MEFLIRNSLAEDTGYKNHKSGWVEYPMAQKLNLAELYRLFTPEWFENQE